MKNRVTQGLMAILLPLALMAGASGAEKATESAPRAMASMMDMERRMGDGDMMVGMTRMMEMMGSMGGSGMMGGQGSMMQPRGAHPGK